MELVRLSNLLGLIAIDARAETDTLLLFVFMRNDESPGYYLIENIEIIGQCW
jgi:hypothetical protein